MSLGFDRELDVVNVSDTAELYAYAYDRHDRPHLASDIVAVTFAVQTPDGVRTSVAGDVEDDGAGFVRWTETTQTGEYKAMAQFELVSGERTSSKADFEVIDPFETDAPTPSEDLRDAVWLRFEDMFDSEDGGPWLRDQTVRFFNKKKIPAFYDEAMFDINVQEPDTTAILDNFIQPIGGAPNPDRPLVVQAVMLAVIRHLVRSYVEQPAVQGAQVVYEDRRDYMERWMNIYQMEHDVYARRVALWKRRFLGMGKSKLLVDTKAGRLLPAPLRTRQIGRGYR